MSTPVSSPSPAGSGPSKITIPYVRPDVHSLLMWEDPKQSGLVFGGITVLCGFLFFSGLPIVSLIAYSLALAMIGFTLWARFGKSVGKPLPELPAILREGISESDWKRYADQAKPHVDKAIGTIYGILTCKDLVFNLKVIGAAFAIGKAFAMIPVFALAYFAVVVAFVAPKVYEQNQAQIDDAVAKAKIEINKVYVKVRDETNKTIQKVPALAKLFGQKQA